MKTLFDLGKEQFMRKSAIALLIGILFLVFSVNVVAEETVTQLPDEENSTSAEYSLDETLMALTATAKSGIDATITYERVEITSDNFVIDELNGVPAYYNMDGEGWVCSEFKNRYYEEVYGDRDYIFVKTYNPKPGDYVYATGEQRGKEYGHYAIVKSYSDGVITLIEQNWDWAGTGEYRFAAKNRQIPFAASASDEYGEYFDTYTVYTPVLKDDSVYFSDVLGTHWAAAYIYDLADQGILNGTSAHLFQPGNSITRAEFAKILFMISGATAEAYQNATSFEDITTTAWYAPYVEWAYQNSIVEGTDGNFLPGNCITRQEMAVMMQRYADHISKTALPQENTPITFVDQGNIATWATEAVTAMQLAGIISGYPDGTFLPKANATRAEAAKIIFVFFETIS